MRKKKSLKTLMLVLVDIFIVYVAYTLSFYFRYEFHVFDEHLVEFNRYFPIIALIYVLFLAIFRMYRSLWRIAGIDEVIYGAVGCMFACGVNLIFMEVLPTRVPRLVTLLACLFICIGVLSVRLSFRFFRRIIIYSNFISTEGKDNVLIVGAGTCGQIILSEIRREKSEEYNLIGIIDDDAYKKNTYLNGIRVIGNRRDIPRVVEEKQVSLIIIAIASITSKSMQELVDICKETKVKLKVVPGISELMDGEIKLNKMRDVDLRDLLGRDPIELDKSGIEQYIKGSTVLVTGAGGSIGSELCRQIARFEPKLLILLDIYENSVYDLQNELSRKIPELNKEVIIASVREKDRLNQIFEAYRPEVVFHAAAHKHVPLMEGSPAEAIKNNAGGTKNLVECADSFGVRRFVLISTDKAVNPTNVMGATKRLCEMIVQAKNKESKTEFVAVRFGNVLGSNGSVVPLFKEQIAEGGPVTLTHKDITRYFMLIPEAAQLVLQAGAYAKGGEIFVLDMGDPVRIYDLAESLIRLSGYEPHKEIQIKVVGLRPGEKLYEELLMDEEGLTQTEHKKIFIGKPGRYSYSEISSKVDKLLQVAHNSDTNVIKEELKKVVPTYHNPKDCKKEDQEIAVTE
ncbi:polysaccharide biosynthesis protein [Clostridium paraputrificum]|uniref:polysaccharide biosynthesis protein n=1 Tax=Clostridium TaxID=1485 RepID=UPI003D3307AC